MSTALADIQKQLQQEMAGLQETIATSSTDLVKIAQGKFVLPDGTSSADPMVVVVLDWIWVNRYYKNAYNPNNMEGPSCYAINRKPEELEPNGGGDMQHTDCKGCPMNVFGSGQGRGKACGNAARIAITSLDEKSDVFFLHVAATSIKSFSGLLTGFSTEKVHPLTVATTISIDPKVTYPKVNFEAGLKHKANLQVLMGKKNKAKEELDLLNFDFD